MTNAVPSNRASTLWIVLLTVASTVTTLALACATPFPALAALAAVHMRRGDGVALVLLAWAASQAVGFGKLGYPHDASTLAWAAGLATAAIGSTLAAHAATQRLEGTPVLARLAIAYLAGFVAFKAVVLVWALFLGGVHTAFAPEILLRQFVRNGAILIGLYALYRLLTALGVPAPMRTRLAA